MANEYTVRVEGLNQLVRDFGKIEKDLRKELQAELKDLARIVQREAQEIATAKGLVRTGKLVRSIRPSVRGGRAFIRETATNKGYAYPRIYEYGHDGVRSFMQPALEAKRNEVYEGLDDMLDRLTDRNGFGRGGSL